MEVMAWEEGHSADLLTGLLSTGPFHFCDSAPCPYPTQIQGDLVSTFQL